MSQNKTENIRALNEFSNMSRKVGATKIVCHSMNPEEFDKVKPAHGGINYDETIKKDDLKKSDFTIFSDDSRDPFGLEYPSLFKTGINNISSSIPTNYFISSLQYYCHSKARYLGDEASAQKILDISDDPLVKFYADDLTAMPEEKWNKITDKIKAISENIETNLSKSTVSMLRNEPNIERNLSLVFSYAMMEAEFLKFNESKKLKEILLNTGDTLLVKLGEDTSYSIGIKEVYDDITDASTWKGKNFHGKLLTNLREQLKNK